MCLLFTNTRGEIVDKRIILRVRQGIEKTIQYIDNLYNRVNEDCLFAVVLSTGMNLFSLFVLTIMRSIKKIRKHLNIL